MRILLLSCHEILEANLIRLFLDLGHEVFSMGAFQFNNHGGGMRGDIIGFNPDPHLAEISNQCSKENLSPELIEWADVVFMMHNYMTPGNPSPQPWLSDNWAKIKEAKKPCVWYSIGQCTESLEQFLKKYRDDGLKIVRHSPREQFIPSFAGEDAMIRFSVDTTLFNGYNGDIPRIVNVSQSMFGSDVSPSRGDHVGIETFKKIVDGFDWKVFGPNNDNAGEHNGGFLSFDDLKTVMKLNRVYLYMGTRPVPYTLSCLEAMATGAPIVSIGPVFGNEIYKVKTFEFHEIIGQPGEAGFWSDSIDELRDYCRQLLENKELALEVGRKGRVKTIEMFGTEKIREEWRKFFDTL